ncbi:MAG: toxin-antitoxin system HicB family antitoxin [bacterium]|nr:toxin-antitoxin system HicB family antitoxin [bacterium]
MSARKSFPLRLSPELYEELRRWADQEFRSVNGQIEYLLREAVRKRTGRAAPPAGGQEP